MPDQLRPKELFFLAQFAANVGPEFFYNDGDRVVSDLGPPYLGGIRHSAIGAGMVAVGGNGGRRSAAKNLGKVELLVPRIGASNDDTADGVSGTMPKSALALLKETRVLVEQRRENSLGHEVLDGAIGKGCPQTLSVALGALSVAGFAVFRLADAGQSGVPGDLDVVERAARHYLELLADGERRNVAAILQGQKIRQGEEQ